MVAEPELSKAYYASLTGSDHSYRIHSSEPFLLYVSVLVPDVEDLPNDLTVKVYELGRKKRLIGEIGGEPDTWQPYFEPFGYDHYRAGPEFKNEVDAGDYELVVSCLNDQGKYVLAVGEKDVFNFAEIRSALILIPILKRDFFLSPPYKFILSPFGIILILSIYALAFGSIFGLRKIFRAKNAAVLGSTGFRLKAPATLARVIIASALLLWSICTLWNPLLIFLSGIFYSEAILKWSPLSFIPRSKKAR